MVQNIFFTVSVGQESRHGFAECLWLKVSHKAAVKVLELQASEGWSEEGSPSQITGLTVDRLQVIAVCWLKSVFFAVRVFRGHSVAVTVL